MQEDSAPPEILATNLLAGEEMMYMREQSDTLPGVSVPGTNVVRLRS